jgi:hypothetical protein
MRPTPTSETTVSHRVPTVSRTRSEDHRDRVWTVSQTGVTGNYLYPEGHTRIRATETNRTQAR